MSKSGGFISPQSAVDKLYADAGIQRPDITDENAQAEYYNQKLLERYAPLIEYSMDPNNSGSIQASLSSAGLLPDYNAISEGLSSTVAGNEPSYDGSSILGENDETVSSYEKLFQLLLQRDKDYNAFVSSENEKNREWQYFMDSQARAFEERMSNTAYQRAFSDMKAAGINPYVAFIGGNGSSASTPNSNATIAPYNEAQKSDAIEKVLSFYGEMLKNQTQSSYYSATKTNQEASIIASTITSFASVLPLIIAAL